MEVADVEDTTIEFWSLGAATARLGAGLCCSRSGASADGPSNFVHQLRPTSVAELEATLDAAEPLCRRIVLDAATASWVEAELVARDWQVGMNLQLVLPPDRPLHRDTAAAELRPLTARDWPTIHEMLRIDHGEEDRRAGRGPRPARHTDEALALRRGIAVHADYLVAAVDDVPVAFTCSWVGPHRLGIVEDVFVHPDQRHRGLASALIAASVAGARRRGATNISIAADPGDIPKGLYQRLGFAPRAVTRTLTAPTGGLGALSVRAAALR